MVLLNTDEQQTRFYAYNLGSREDSPLSSLLERTNARDIIIPSFADAPTLEQALNKALIHKPPLVFNSDNNNHHATAYIISGNFSEPFVYVHIDAHKDYKALEKRPLPTYDGFVQHIAKLSHCEGICMVGDSVKDFELPRPNDELAKKTNFILVKRERDLRRIPKGNIYISMDLDVLDRSEMWTPYSHQGSMKHKSLINILTYLRENYNIIGADICGLPIKPPREGETQRVIEISNIFLEPIQS